MRKRNHNREASNYMAYIRDHADPVRKAENPKRAALALKRYQQDQGATETKPKKNYFKNK